MPPIRATRQCGCGVSPVVSVRCGEDAEYVERSIEERGVIRRRQIMVAGVMPSAPVQPGNVLVIGKSRLALSLLVAINVHPAFGRLRRVV